MNIVETERQLRGLLIVVLTLTHRYNAVRGHRTALGSNNSGAEDYLQEENKHKPEDNTHNN